MRSPWLDFDIARNQFFDDESGCITVLEHCTELVGLTTASEGLTFDLGPLYISLMINLCRRMKAYFSPVAKLYRLQALGDIKDMGALSDSAREIKKVR